MIIVSAKIAGGKKPFLKDREMEIPGEISGPGSSPDLATLIEMVVREEVASFHKRQEERKLVEILSKENIDAVLETGRVSMGGHDFEQRVEPEKAVANALEAFEDGLYFVFIDDVKYERLDAPVVLKEGSRVLFLRLIALSGGYF